MIHSTYSTAQFSDVCSFRTSILDSANALRGENRSHVSALHSQRKKKQLLLHNYGNSAEINSEAEAFYEDGILCRGLGSKSAYMVTL